MYLVERDSGVDDCSEDDDSRQVSQSQGARESARPVLAYQRPGRLQEQVQSDTSLRSIPPVRPLLEQLREDHSRNFGWALACCGWQRELAEDALQEAYLRVLDGRARFGGRSAASTWFYAVATDLGKDFTAGGRFNRKVPGRIPFGRGQRESSGPQGSRRRA